MANLDTYSWRQFLTASFGTGNICIALCFTSWVKTNLKLLFTCSSNANFIHITPIEIYIKFYAIQYYTCLMPFISNRSYYPSDLFTAYPHSRNTRFRNTKLVYCKESLDGLFIKSVYSLQSDLSGFSHQWRLTAYCEYRLMTSHVIFRSSTYYNIYFRHNLI